MICWPHSSWKLKATFYFICFFCRTVVLLGCYDKHDTYMYRLTGWKTNIWTQLHSTMATLEQMVSWKRHKRVKQVNLNSEQTGAEASRPICWSLQVEGWEAPALLPACLRRIKKICLCLASWGHSDCTLTAKAVVCVNLSFKQRRVEVFTERKNIHQRWMIQFHRSVEAALCSSAVRNELCAVNKWHYREV